MNVDQGKKKKKYNIDDFADKIPGRINLCILPNCECVCNEVQIMQHIICKKCGQKQHKCLQGNKRNGQCLKCIARNLDPMYTVRKDLYETCFRTLNVFEYQNTLEMTFDLDHNDANSPIEIRGLFPNNKTLNWPMQGSFYINGQNIPFQQLRPLLINTNRKSRREDYIIVPKDKVLIGKNTIIFKIPKLTKRFQQFYKIHVEGVYFFGVYLIYKISKENLIKKVIRQNKMQKQESINFLNSFSTSDFEVQKQKISIMCPYTKQRIRIPVRGRNCQHFSCLCLETLIAHHQSYRTWICPICDKDRLNEPVIDMWIYQLLMQDNKYSEVILSIDGTHEWVQNAEEINQLSDDSEEERMVFKIPSEKPNNSLKRQDPIIIKAQIGQPRKICSDKQEIVLSDDQDPTLKQSEKAQNDKRKVIIQKKDQTYEQSKQKQANQRIKLNKEIGTNIYSQSLYRSPDRNFLTKLLESQTINKRNISKKRSQQQTSNPKEFKSIQKLVQPQQVQIQPLVCDAISKQFKNMSLYEFQRHYVKSEQKPKIPQGVRKLFKQIL